MDNEHVVLHIMTDLKNSRSNIAASFQNAIAAQLLPPIGVFWDIENIQVPKGKSASALVNSIRDRFFKRHREAEFMCVCDINKENKSIIHELNDAQVTVVHVDATSKNAADEKLRQCMRRFVDTHGTPATLLLISDDVNFAGDLSDFRHRHHIRIILLHRNHAPEPLLACANEHHSFSELTLDLPWRSPLKVPNNRPRDLIVTSLPLNSNAANIKKCLRRLSDNCGGKVLCVTKSKAIVSFANADAAERAQKRMDNEVVFGQRVTVNFLYPDSADYREYVLSRSLHKDSYSRGGFSCSSGSSRDSSPHCDLRESSNEESQSEKKKCQKSFVFPDPPVLDGHNLPTLLKLPLLAAKDSNFVKESAAANEIKFNSFTAKQNDCIPSKNLWDDNLLGCSALLKDRQSSSSFTWSKSSFMPIKEIQNSQYQAPRSFTDPYGHGPLYQNSGFPSTTASGLNNLSKSDIISFPLFPNSSGGKSLHLDAIQPISKSDPNVGREVSTPVELFVTNLDQSVEINEMKKVLQCVFREHVMVLHITMQIQPDGNPKAIVKVPSLQHAQYAISQLQRRKIGHKRILISHTVNDRIPPFAILKSEVVSLLKDIPSKRLPLFKFREMYEKRYNRTISVSEMYKMRDVILIQEDLSGRMVSLNIDFHVNSPSPTDSDSIHSQELAVLEKPYCERHYHPVESQGWAEQQAVPPLPDVYIRLKVLAPAVHTLLDSHQGSLPLNSFCACYEAEIGSLPVVSDGTEESFTQTNDLPEDLRASANCQPKGVHLEHLISCIAGIEIVKSRLCIKKVQWCENRAQIQPAIRSISPALAGPLAGFGREMSDLLKNQPCCIVLFNKFIPVYHHHFGRQCRVADYGFTKLIDLLEAIPHIIQVLGEGQNRLVTLTHRMQVKRFAADLLRILKARASKQLTLVEFPQLFEDTTEKPFIITNYGVCDIQDMLVEISENVVIVTVTTEDTIIAIPKREQTKEEIERTKIFSQQVIELLKHTPTCSMPFNKFIPAYHHHYGKQCRVADFGFSKLIELFEVIPFIEITGTGEDKILNLGSKEQSEVLCDRFVTILESQQDKMAPINVLSSIYTDMYGHILHPEDFNATDMVDLLNKFEVIKIFDGYGTPLVTLSDSDFVRQAFTRTVKLLMQQKEGKLSIAELNIMYKKNFGYSLDISALRSELEAVTEMNGRFIKLNKLHMLARAIILLLQKKSGSMYVSELESSYYQQFGISLQPSQYGFQGLLSLLGGLGDYITVMKKKKKNVVILNPELCASPLPNTLDDRLTISAQILKTPEKIEGDPVQSCVLSPASTTSTNSSYEAPTRAVHYLEKYVPSSSVGTNNHVDTSWKLSYTNKGLSTCDKTPTLTCHLETPASFLHSSSSQFTTSLSSRNASFQQVPSKYTPPKQIVKDIPSPSGGGATNAPLLRKDVNVASANGAIVSSPSRVDNNVISARSVVTPPRQGIKDNLSPLKVMETSPNVSSPNNRKSGGTRIAALFSNPLESQP